MHILDQEPHNPNGLNPDIFGLVFFYGDEVVLDETGRYRLVAAIQDFLEQPEEGELFLFGAPAFLKLLQNPHPEKFLSFDGHFLEQLKEFLSDDVDCGFCRIR